MSGAGPYLVDRSKFPSGPWDTEPDRQHWVDEDTGYDCLIVRKRLGALCGYVGVPEGHPWYGVHYDDVGNVDVHGGLTFSDHGHGHICHTPEEAAHEPVWWLGFDCAHEGDLVPGRETTDRIFGFRLGGGNNYRDMDYVREECSSLAEQVQQAA